jgi:hypothetical protein
MTFGRELLFIIWNARRSLLRGSGTQELIFTASIANALLFLSSTNSIFEPVKDHPREKGIP